MTDTQSIVTSMAALTDDEIRAVVAAATLGRPGLATLHAAALEIRLEPEPAVPVPPVPPHVAGTPEVPPPPVIMDAEVVPEPGRTPTTSAVPGVAEATGYTDAGVPTFDSVREKIETRAGTAEGATELDAQSGSGRTLEEQYVAREKAAQERLAEIRKSLPKH